MANVDDSQVVPEYYEFMKELLIDEMSIKTQIPAKVIVARDTRASGPHLLKALLACLKATSVEVVDYGYLTTPQLHYMVRCANTKDTQYEYGEATEEGYYRKTVTAFKTVMRGRTSNGNVTVDCANGVGGPKLRELIKYLPTAKEGGVDIKVVNDNVVKPEALNYEVRILDTLRRVQQYTESRPRLVWRGLRQDQTACSTLFKSRDSRALCLIRWRRGPHRLLLQRHRQRLQTSRRRPHRNPCRIVHRRAGQERWHRIKDQGRGRTNRLR